MLSRVAVHGRVKGNGREIDMVTKSRRQARSPYRRALLEVLEPRVLLSTAHVAIVRARSMVPLPVIQKKLTRTTHPIVVVKKSKSASAKPASGGLPPSSALTPAELRHAYGFDQVTFG